MRSRIREAASSPQIERQSKGFALEHNPAVALFLAIGLIVAASRLAGALARRLGQPRVLGELIVGVILGPTALDLLHLGLFRGVELEHTIELLAELGVLLLMFLVGLEVDLGELAGVGRAAVIGGVVGALAPVILALPLTLAFGYTWEPALFAGVTLAATSVSISAQVLLELGFLRTREGSALLAAALVDDVVAILLVSLTIAITGSSQGVDAGSLMGIIARMAVYLVAATAVAWFVLPRLIEWIADHPRLAQSYGVAAFGLTFALLFAWSADTFGGIAAITGAFVAGVGFGRARMEISHEIEEAASHIAYAFLVPIFFVNIGLQTDLRGFPLSALPLALALLVVALVSKIGGCGLGMWLGGLDRGESLRVGVAMISRGEVGLIILALTATDGIIRPDEPLFASLFLVILLTTVLAPPLVRLVFRGRDAPEPELLITEGATSP